MHRWLGIVGCLLFAMWFLSGLVMIYVPFPALGKAERLAGSPPIDWSRVRTAPGEAVVTAMTDAPPRTVLLEMRADRPVWRISGVNGPEIDIDARDGRRLGPADAAEAVRAAQLFSGRRAVSCERVFRDQWTVAGGFDRHRPLWKVALGGAGGKVLYVSSRTGAVVLDTDARERFWNWLGSVPHWLYPTVLRQDNSAWRQVVMWVSGPCIIAAMTGMWIGILRTRVGRRRFKAGRMTPYRGWMHWHHIAGLVGGLFLLAWIFSGWLSVDPFRLFASGGITPAARAAYERVGTPPPFAPARLAAIAPGAKRIEWHWMAARPLVVVERPMVDPIVLDAATLLPAQLDETAIVAAAGALSPGVRIAAVDQLTEPDSYWYEIDGRPQLPVLRLRFDDAARTWVHIDPRTGAILGDLDARRRLYRWLFDLLHKWDLNVLTAHRPLWDVLLWLLSIAGTITSVSGVWIGWRRLAGSKTRPHRARARSSRIAPSP